MTASMMTREEAEAITARIKAGFQQIRVLEAERAMLPPEPVKQKPDRRHVYFIRARATGMIKIGVAGNPWSRLLQIRTMSPDRLDLLAIIRGVGAAGESSLHRDLAEFRSHGEWFYPSQEVLAVIDGAESV